MSIAAQPATFTTEQAKCVYVASYLRGPAFRWAQPILDHEPVYPLLLDLSSFLRGLRQVFGDPDEISTAERHLGILRQTTSAAKYASDFLRRLSTSLSWHDAALQFHFYNGPKEIIKDELCKMDKPTSLFSLMETAIRSTPDCTSAASRRLRPTSVRGRLPSHPSIHTQHPDPFEKFTTPPKPRPWILTAHDPELDHSIQKRRPEDDVLTSVSAVAIQPHCS